MSPPDRDPLPRYVAPLPPRLEDVAFRYLWPIVAVNLLGTAFGFWYYRFQFAATPLVAWPVVPDSPTATLFVALSLAAWRLGRQRRWLDALAFFGCIKLGAWTPYVLVVFAGPFLRVTWLPLYLFLFFSHCAMVVQAFVIHRYSDFPVGGVAVAVGWYLLNDVVDYFVPVVGRVHHTAIPVADGSLVFGRVTAGDLAAVGAVSLTVLATFLALATRAKKLEARLADA